MEEIVESECDLHGVDAHIWVHEAGHALAALDNDLEFRAVVHYAQNDAPTWHGGLMTAPAAVEMSPKDPAEWTFSSRSAVFRHLSAGAIAEAFVLDHALDVSAEGDYKAWATFIGQTAPTNGQDPELDGSWSLPVLVAQTQEWAAGRVEEIRLLAARLGELSPGSEVSFAEVVDFMKSIR